MAWVPLADSETGELLEFFSDLATLQESTVVCAGLVFPEWGFNTFNNAVQMRVTAQSYSTSDGGATPAYFSWADDEEELEQHNEGDQNVEFLPSPFEINSSADSTQIMYHPSSAEGEPEESFEFFIEIWEADPQPAVSYNCECEDDYPARRTLVELRHELARRLGYGAQVANLPPGMTELLNSFLQGAQRALYRRYSVLRTRRIFRWPLVEGVRFYDLDGNDDVCTKKLDPRKVEWVGIERDGTWVPLVCGIPPEVYSYPQIGWPSRYEIRQCIEIWPTPDSTVQYLRVKGDFELERFTEDADKATIDDELIFLLALANAKAHYNKTDANNYIAQLETMMANLVAGSHHTRRYIPGQRVRAPTPEPVWVDGQWPPLP